MTCCREATRRDEDTAVGSRHERDEIAILLHRVNHYSKRRAISSLVVCPGERCTAQRMIHGAQ